MNRTSKNNFKVIKLISDENISKIEQKHNYFYIIKFFIMDHLYKIQTIIFAIIVLFINGFNDFKLNKNNNRNTQINNNYTNYYHQYFGHIRKFITNDIIKYKEHIIKSHKKPILKMNCFGVYSSFKLSNCHFIKYLRQYFEIESSNNPDYVYYGSNWNGTIIYPNAINICMETENIFPDLNKCDYAIGYPFLVASDRYIQKSHAPSFMRYSQEIKNARKNVKKVRSKFCGAMIKNRLGNFRNKFIIELNKYKVVENAGKYRKNVNFIENPKSHKYQNKVNFLKQYKFSIAMENSFNTGYISEKIITCFLAGTIPIYYGDTSLESFINPKTFIQIKPWDDIKEKIKLIKKIDTNDKLYFKMLNEDLNADTLISKLQAQDYQDMADYIFFQDKNKARRRGDSQYIKLI